MRAQIEQDAGARLVRAFTPRTGLGLETKAVEARFELHHLTQRPRRDEFLHGVKISVIPAVVINGNEPFAFRCQPHQFFRFFHRGRERLVHHHVPPRQQAGLGQLEMRIVGSRHHHQADALVGKQFLQRSRHPSLRILFARQRSAALKNASQFHAGYALDHRRVERLPCQSKADQSHSYHNVSFL